MNDKPETLRQILGALGVDWVWLSKFTGFPAPTVRQWVYSGRVPRYPKPERVKRALRARNQNMGRPVDPSAIRNLWRAS